MTVKELIEALECHDPDADVMLGYEQNDHWDTSVAERISCTSHETLAWHDGYQKWELDGGEDDEDCKTCDAVVLR